jgi:hypothetical protein
MAGLQELNSQTRKSINDRMQSAVNLDTDFDRAQAKGQISPMPTPNLGAQVQQDGISRKVGKIYGQNISDMTALERASHPFKAMGKQLDALNMGAEVKRFDLAREQYLKDLRAKRRAQRSSVLGSVLGLVGTVVGAYVGFQAGGGGGAMAGAQAGGQAGGALGNSIGG